MKIIRLLLVLLASAATVPAYAEFPDTVVTRNASAAMLPRKKVGLVLSGGGAKGVAHVGVIKVLEEAGIPIDYIAGTSMGAIVGGLYAIGYTTKDLDSLFRSQDWMSLLSDRVPRTDRTFVEKRNMDTYIISLPLYRDNSMKLPVGVVAGQNVFNMLTELTIGYHENYDFSRMPIPFSAVAYDMAKGREYVARSGSLPIAIRASMSIPGAFEPVMLDSMCLVDGGIYNNFPADVVKDMGAEVIIGVDLFGGLKDAEGLQTILDLVDQITTFLGREKYAENLKIPDLYLHPDIHPYNSASFTAAAIDTLLERGEREARKNWDKIVELRKIIGIDSTFRPVPIPDPMRRNDTLQIGRIIFDGPVSVKEEYRLRRELQISQYARITKKQLNDVIGRLRGSGIYGNVSFRLDNNPPYNLTIILNKIRRGSVNLGLRFDSEEMAGILLNTTIASRGMQGYRLGATARLSENPYVRLDLVTGRFLAGRIGVNYMYQYNDFRLNENGRKLNNITFNLNRAEAFFTDLYLQNFRFNIGVQWDYYDIKPFLYAPDDYISRVGTSHYFNWFALGHYESLNDMYYPTSGWSVSAKYTLHTDNFAQHNGGKPFSSIQYEFSTALSLSSRLTLLPSLYGRSLIGSDIDFPYLNFIGGNEAGRYMAQQLPFVGVGHIEAVDNSFMAVSLDVRVRLWKRQYVSLRGNYAIQNDDFLDMFSDRHDIWGIGLQYSYQTPVGPISLQVDTSSKTRKFGIYFSLGKYF